ncbi:hypothetical protein DX887_02475 [Vibrio alginolyticus]|uniref:hypothetical protein n=1 Tax=Vibrio parahaemolyticus TaxID=670 RepID=UPI00235E647F|nr:hypothetical protein [Vibrio parahaemolyticus]EGR2554634.1 hypothetical protein [Vibrio alginolyticus]
MSRKENLKKRVDELCKELGITEPQYSDKTTEAQLNKVIDDLEAKLPDMDESDDESQSQTQGNDANHTASDQSEQTESQASEKSEVLIGAAVELPDDATVLDDGEPTEVNADEKGNVQVLVDKPFQCLQGQKTVLLKRGNKPFLDEETAMEAVDAGLAYFVATM